MNGKYIIVKEGLRQHRRDLWRSLNNYINNLDKGRRWKMEKDLKNLLNDYINQVNDLCMNLLVGLDLHNKTELIQYLYMGKERIWELCINNVAYKFHGSGCNAYYGGREIQWDFGRRSHWCGIDPEDIILLFL